MTEATVMFHPASNQYRIIHALRLLVCCAVAILGFTSFASDALGQDDQTITDLNARVSRFLDNVASTDEPEKAFEDIIAEGPLANPSRSEDVAKLVSGYTALQSRCGEFISAESISAKRIGADLVFLKFLYKADRFPVIWYFVFYHRPIDEKTNWSLVSLRFDTQLEALGASP